MDPNTSTVDLYGDIDEMYTSQTSTTQVLDTSQNTDLYSGTDVPSDAPEDEVDSGVKGHHNDLDLYDDLITEEVQQKAESHQEMLKRFEEAMSMVKRLESENQVLRKSVKKQEMSCRDLQKNFSSLLVTARGEISRKEREINDLRKSMAKFPGKRHGNPPPFKPTSDSSITSLDSSFEPMFVSSPSNRAQDRLQCIKPNSSSRSKEMDRLHSKESSSPSRERARDRLHNKDSNSLSGDRARDRLQSRDSNCPSGGRAKDRLHSNSPSRERARDKLQSRDSNSSSRERTKGRIQSRDSSSPSGDRRSEMSQPSRKGQLSPSKRDAIGKQKVDKIAQERERLTAAYSQKDNKVKRNIENSGKTTNIDKSEGENVQNIEPRTKVNEVISQDSDDEVVKFDGNVTETLFTRRIREKLHEEKKEKIKEMNAKSEKVDRNKLDTNGESSEKNMYKEDHLNSIQLDKEKKPSSHETVMNDNQPGRKDIDETIKENSKGERKTCEIVQMKDLNSANLTLSSDIDKGVRNSNVSNETRSSRLKVNASLMKDSSLKSASPHVVETGKNNDPQAKLVSEVKPVSKEILTFDLREKLKQRREQTQTDIPSISKTLRNEHCKTSIKIPPISTKCKENAICEDEEKTVSKKYISAETNEVKKKTVEKINSQSKLKDTDLSKEKAFLDSLKSFVVKEKKTLTVKLALASDQSNAVKVKNVGSPLKHNSRNVVSYSDFDGEIDRTVDTTGERNEKVKTTDVDSSMTQSIDLESTVCDETLNYVDVDSQRNETSKKVNTGMSSTFEKEDMDFDDTCNEAVTKNNDHVDTGLEVTGNNDKVKLNKTELSTDASIQDSDHLEEVESVGVRRSTRLNSKRNSSETTLGENMDSCDRLKIGSSEKITQIKSPTFGRQNSRRKSSESQKLSPKMTVKTETILSLTSVEQQGTITYIVKTNDTDTDLVYTKECGNTGTSINDLEAEKERQGNTCTVAQTAEKELKTGETSDKVKKDVVNKTESTKLDSGLTLSDAEKIKEDETASQSEGSMPEHKDTSAKSVSENKGLVDETPASLEISACSKKSSCHKPNCTIKISHLHPGTPRKISKLVASAQKVSESKKDFEIKSDMTSMSSKTSTSKCLVGNITVQSVEKSKDNGHVTDESLVVVKGKEPEIKSYNIKDSAKEKAIQQVELKGVKATAKEPITVKRSLVVDVDSTKMSESSSSDSEGDSSSSKSSSSKSSSKSSSSKTSLKSSSSRKSKSGSSSSSSTSSYSSSSDSSSSGSEKDEKQLAKRKAIVNKDLRGKPEEEIAVMSEMDISEGLEEQAIVTKLSENVEKSNTEVDKGQARLIEEDNDRIKDRCTPCSKNNIKNSQRADISNEIQIQKEGITPNLDLKGNNHVNEETKQSVKPDHEQIVNSVLIENNSLDIVENTNLDVNSELKNNHEQREYTNQRILKTNIKAVVPEDRKVRSPEYFATPIHAKGLPMDKLEVETIKTPGSNHSVLNQSADRSPLLLRLLSACQEELQRKKRLSGNKVGELEKEEVKTRESETDVDKLDSAEELIINKQVDMEVDEVSEAPSIVSQGFNVRDTEIGGVDSEMNSASVSPSGTVDVLTPPQEKIAAPKQNGRDTFIDKNKAELSENKPGPGLKIFSKDLFGSNLSLSPSASVKSSRSSSVSSTKSSSSVSSSSSGSSHSSSRSSSSGSGSYSSSSYSISESSDSEKECEVESKSNSKRNSDEKVLKDMKKRDVTLEKNELREGHFSQIEKQANNQLRTDKSQNTDEISKKNTLKKNRGKASIEINNMFQGRKKRSDKVSNNSGTTTTMATELNKIDKKTIDGLDKSQKPKALKISMLDVTNTLSQDGMSNPYVEEDEAPAFMLPDKSSPIKGENQRKTRKKKSPVSGQTKSSAQQNESMKENNTNTNLTKEATCTIKGKKESNSIKGEDSKETDVKSQKIITEPKLLNKKKSQKLSSESKSKLNMDVIKSDKRTDVAEKSQTDVYKIQTSTMPENVEEVLPLETEELERESMGSPKSVKLTADEKHRKDECLRRSPRFKPSSILSIPRSEKPNADRQKNNDEITEAKKLPERTSPRKKFHSCENKRLPHVLLSEPDTKSDNRKIGSKKPIKSKSNESVKPKEMLTAGTSPGKSATVDKSIHDANEVISNSSNQDNKVKRVSSDSLKENLESDFLREIEEITSDQAMNFLDKGKKRVKSGNQNNKEPLEAFGKQFADIQKTVLSDAKKQKFNNESYRDTSKEYIDKLLTETLKLKDTSNKNQVKSRTVAPVLINSTADSLKTDEKGASDKISNIENIKGKTLPGIILPNVQSGVLKKFTIPKLKKAKREEKDSRTQVKQKDNERKHERPVSVKTSSRRTHSPRERSKYDTFSRDDGSKRKVLSPRKRDLHHNKTRHHSESSDSGREDVRRKRDTDKLVSVLFGGDTVNDKRSRSSLDNRKPNQNERTRDMDKNTVKSLQNSRKDSNNSGNRGHSSKDSKTVVASDRQKEERHINNTKGGQNEKEDKPVRYEKKTEIADGHEMETIDSTKDNQGKSDNQAKSDIREDRNSEKSEENVKSNKNSVEKKLSKSYHRHEEEESEMKNTRKENVYLDKAPRHVKGNRKTTPVKKSPRKLIISDKLFKSPLKKDHKQKNDAKLKLCYKNGAVKSITSEESIIKKPELQEQAVDILLLDENTMDCFDYDDDMCLDNSTIVDNDFKKSNDIQIEKSQTHRNEESHSDLESESVSISESGSGELSSSNSEVEIETEEKMDIKRPTVSIDNKIKEGMQIHTPKATRECITYDDGLFDVEDELEYDNTPKKRSSKKTLNSFERTSNFSPVKFPSRFEETSKNSESTCKCANKRCVHKRGIDVKSGSVIKSRLGGRKGSSSDIDSCSDINTPPRARRRYRDKFNPNVVPDQRRTPRSKLSRLHRRHSERDRHYRERHNRSSVSRTPSPRTRPERYRSGHGRRISRSFSPVCKRRRSRSFTPKKRLEKYRKRDHRSKDAVEDIGKSEDDSLSTSRLRKEGIGKTKYLDQRRKSFERRDVLRNQRRRESYKRYSSASDESEINSDSQIKRRKSRAKPDKRDIDPLSTDGSETELNMVKSKAIPDNSSSDDERFCRSKFENDKHSQDRPSDDKSRSKRETHETSRRDESRYSIKSRKRRHSSVDRSPLGPRSRSGARKRHKRASLSESDSDKGTESRRGRVYHESDSDETKKKGTRKDRARQR
ncbi:uncharacterized protein LOC128237175 [Mya arenaria]|uniref:uncharacterized protein LOC128237175 n=1 Tax=Mya arenaria TaxID=6604 RepID=UPI0022E4DFD1|nr:uncharacterized protein LOC128237175 [Mya arenaria]XP_052808430.1 uncharacterized protein LOC128237175 [Mya arenaria]XP_052808431.1 uncharacterized protein LOC128237175 [Mya arenaria]